MANLADRSMHPIVNIVVDVLAPEPRNNLLPVDEGAAPFHQQQEQFHRQALQSNRSAPASELISRRVDFVLAELPNHFRQFYYARNTAKHSSCQADDPTENLENFSGGSPLSHHWKTRMISSGGYV